MLKNFWRDESGQDLVEYVLVCGVVALGAVVGLAGVRDGIRLLWSTLNTAIGATTSSIDTTPLS